MKGLEVSNSCETIEQNNHYAHTTISRIREFNATVILFVIDQHEIVNSHLWGIIVNSHTWLISNYMNFHHAPDRGTIIECDQFTGLHVIRA